MKRVVAGCIDLLLEFDAEHEFENYVKGIEAKNQRYNIISRETLNGDIISVRIQRQYNNSPFPKIMKGGE